MNDDFFKYLVATDQLDEFLGLEEQDNNEEIIDEFEDEEIEDDEDDN